MRVPVSDLWLGERAAAGSGPAAPDPGTSAASADVSSAQPWLAYVAHTTPPPSFPAQTQQGLDSTASQGAIGSEGGNSGSGGVSSSGGGSGAGAGVSQGPAGGDIMRRVTPVGPDSRMLAWGGRTHIMAILNVTPDSFSDGGRLMGPGSSPAASSSSSAAGSAAAAAGSPGAVDLGAVVATAKQLVASGADMLDVGGLSTRPGSLPVSEQEELARVVPAIRCMLGEGRGRDVHDGLFC